MIKTCRPKSRLRGTAFPVLVSAVALLALAG